MRYVPKNKRSKPKQAFPGQFSVGTNGVMYQGLYVTLPNKEYYAYENGDINTGKRLYAGASVEPDIHEYDPIDVIDRADFFFDYYDLKGGKLISTQDIPQANYRLTTINYEHGSYLRFFVKNSITGKTFEIGPNAATLLRSQSDIYHWPSYTLVEVEWKIAGDVADKEISGYLVEGVETLNKRAVEEASKIIPELSNILTDYLEYHQ